MVEVEDRRGTGRRTNNAPRVMVHANVWKMSCRYQLPFMQLSPTHVRGIAKIGFLCLLLTIWAQPSSQAGRTEATIDNGRHRSLYSPTNRHNVSLTGSENTLDYGEDNGRGMMTSSRVAFVTLLYSDFLHGTRALGQSLRDTGTMADKVVLVTPDVTAQARETLSRDGWM